MEVTEGMDLVLMYFVSVEPSTGTLVDLTFIPKEAGFYHSILFSFAAGDTGPRSIR